MARSLALVLTLVGTLFAFPSTVSAQAPKLARDYYEDPVDLGFKVKAIKDWEFVPPTPSERNLIGKYAPPNSQYIILKGDATLFLNVWMLKFDRREGKKKGIADIDTWMKSRIDEGKGWRRTRTKPKDISGKVKVPARCLIFEGQSLYNMNGDPPEPIKAHVAMYELSDDLEVAIVGIGPGDKRKWRTYEKVYASMAKSFRTVEVERVVAATSRKDPRSAKREKLAMEAAKSEDWIFEETENYFIISNNQDREFLDELKQRLEAIRAVLERDYPFEKARRRSRRKKDDDDPEANDRSVSVADPRVLSRTSVVRVFKDRKQYIQYGAPPSSAGYWYSVDEELVLYDDKQNAGREYTWGVLSHEAFHQYIFYFYGNLAPHSWYNEGTGDYYFGHQFKYKRFNLAEAKGRKSVIQQMIREDNYVPLRDFVRWTKTQYYRNNELGLGGGECYAQGWSLIYFLRTGGDNKAPGWDRSWGKILDKYLVTLAETGDLDEAVDAAFGDVDWDAFEKSWYAYTK